MWAALLNRQPTFLCSPEWTIVPWEHHPRTALDDLLDIAVLLPSIYSRADSIIALSPSADRGFKAKELLEDCFNIETQFGFWYEMMQQTVRDPPQEGGLYWLVNAGPGNPQAPFQSTFAFTTPLVGLIHVTYWAVLVSFHQCIYTLLEIMFQSQGGTSAAGSGLPMGVDIQRYQPSETKKLADNVCRSMDFVLATTFQPDLLAAPLWTVTDFFSRINQFGNAERLWCAGCQGRLEARKQQLRAWLQEKNDWVELQRFG